MRARRGLAAALLWALALPAPAAEMRVDELVLEMKPRDADVLFKKYYYDTSTFPVTLVQPDGTRLEGRIEVKGETARVFDKKPVLVKLAGGKWRGHSRISLNAMATDDSLMREWLSWDLIHRLGPPAPDVGYVRLKINGVEQGIYFQVEWVGPNVFDRFGFGKDGELFDPVDRISCADLSPASVEDPERCWGKITPRDNDFTPLKRLVEAIDAEPVETMHRFLEEQFDAESVINWIAVTVLVENLTTYNNEYWPYLSKQTGKWVVMPWDYDRTFGKNFDPDLPYPRNKINDNFQYYYPVEVGASNALRDKLFKNPATMQRIRARVLEIIDGAPDARRPWAGWWAPARMAERIAQLQALLAPEVARDPHLAAEPRRFEHDVESVRHFAVARAHYLQRTLAERWLGEPDRGSAPLRGAGQALHVIDGWGYLLARVTPQAAAAGGVAVALRRGWPELVPPGLDRGACVQRTWLLTAPRALEADVTVEYFEEIQRKSELGPRVGSEGALVLYARDERGWWQLPTAANPLANTLSARVRFPGPAPLRLVGCASAPATAAAAAP
jgi:hypothetical protein